MGNIKSDEKVLRDCQLAIKTDPILLHLHKQMRDFVVKAPLHTIKLHNGSVATCSAIPDELIAMAKNRISEIMNDFGVTASQMGVPG